MHFLENCQTKKLTHSMHCPNIWWAEKASWRTASQTANSFDSAFAAAAAVATAVGAAVGFAAED